MQKYYFKIMKTLSISSISSIVSLLFLLTHTASGQSPEKSQLKAQTFQLDTLAEADKGQNTEYRIILPISGINTLDKRVRADVEKQKDDFLKEIYKMMEKKEYMKTFPAPSSFYAEPASVYSDEKLVSYLFHISYYHAGYAHPMNLQYSYNYNKKTEERIWLNDYFSLTTATDSSFLIESIAISVHQEPYFIKKLYEVDFNVEKDSISFNFDNYEIAPYSAGLIRGKVSKFNLKMLINDSYSK